MRVLHATPTYAPAYRIGGPVHSLEGLVRALSAAGVDVRVVTTDAHAGDRLDVPSSWTTRDGIPVRYLRGVRGDATPRTFDVVLREARDADVVHVTAVFNVPSVLALSAALVARRPVVLSTRGVFEAKALASGSSRGKRAWLAAVEPLLRRVDVIHVTSDTEADSVRRELPSSRIVVVPNGTAIPEPREFHEVGPPRILALGRIHPIKGLDRLVRAGGVLHGRGRSFEFVLAGPKEVPAYVAELEMLAREVGIADRVRFVGEVQGEAKAGLWSSSRVLALPSHSENFGNVVVEALANEVPVVASLGTPWKILEEAGAGRWTDTEPTQLADALEPYLADIDLAREQGARGRELVRERFGWSAVANEMLRVYRELV